MSSVALVERPAHIPANRVVDFDIYAPPGGKQDYHAAWKALQDSGVPDIVWTPHNGGHWIATRNGIIRDIMADYEHFSSKCQIIPKAPEPHPEEMLLPSLLDPPEHRPFRNLLNSGLAPKTVSRTEGKIRQLAIDLIEAVRMQGYCNFSTDYAANFPIQIFLSMIDLPIADAPMLKSWSDQMLRPLPGIDWSPDRSSMARGIRLFKEYLDEHVDARMGGAGDDMLSRLVNGKVDGRSLTKDEALQLSAQVLIAGLDTVVNFLGFVMLHLARHPEHRRELVANPTLIPDAVEEMLRRFPIVIVGREIVQDIEYHSVAMKRGEMIVTPTPLGGLDERDNVDPMAVDFHRDTAEHATFGNGAHRCPGAHLARTEIRITLEEWLKRIPEFSVAPGCDVEFTGGVVAVVDELPLVWDVTGSLVATDVVVD